MHLLYKLSFWAAASALWALAAAVRARPPAGRARPSHLHIKKALASKWYYTNQHLSYRDESTRMHRIPSFFRLNAIS
jgi:hypothetical protein